MNNVDYVFMFLLVFAIGVGLGALGIVLAFFA
jgi:hypothetical protein